MRNLNKKNRTPIKGTLLLLVVGLLIAGVGTWLGGIESIVLLKLPFMND